MPDDMILRAISTGAATTVPTRQEIRGYVAGQVRAVMAHTKAGGNPHHLLFDQSDRVQQFAALLPAHERESFMRVYTEELAAATAAVTQQADHKEFADIKAATANYTVLRFAALLVFLLALMFIFRAAP